MSKCEQSGCVGHLGKFSSCLDEAVYYLSLDWMERWDGDMDFGLSWCVMDIDGETTYEDEAAGLVVMVPAGVYLIETNSQGFVYVSRWEACESGFAETILGLERDYAAWLDQE